MKRHEHLDLLHDQEATAQFESFQQELQYIKEYDLIKNLTQSYEPEKHATCIKAAFGILIPFLSHIKKYNKTIRYSYLDL